MPSAKVALILAAGNGSRLASASHGGPKPLVELNGKPLIEHVMLGARAAGIRRFEVVVGYRANDIRMWAEARRLDGVQIRLVENQDWQKKDNGSSVLKARNLIHEPFLLLMADHVFEPANAAALVRESLVEDGAILAVDHKLRDIFDLDDATKVLLSGRHVAEIGKNLEHYDAADTGMFLCSPNVFRWLELATKNENCSLSDGMRLMARNRRLRAFDIGDGLWQDVDTPGALANAELMFAEPPTSHGALPEFAFV